MITNKSTIEEHEEDFSVCVCVTIRGNKREETRWKQNSYVVTTKTSLYEGKKTFKRGID